MDSLIWLIIFAVMVLVEIITLGLTTIWFAGGALIAFLAALFGANIVVEIILFIVVSLVLLYFTRPVAVRYFNVKRVPTNSDRLIGMTAKVTELIDNINNQGNVDVNGQIWAARSQDDSVISAGEMVVIHHIEGVKLIVSKKEEM